ncbi:MAG: ATP-dependent DNA helicase [Hylemonella sp.]
MSLREEVQAAFAPQGLLARTVHDFRPRPGQTEMALAVADAIASHDALVVEAGTGVGKTYAYLVPALLSGQRVLLSTATKTLQDQLHGRDLPRLIRALGLPVRTALLKGRGSYLCLHRLALAREAAADHGPAVQHALARIAQWAQGTRSGDLAELPGLDERSPALALATSTRDNCLGSNCPRWRDCHVNLARREALGADVVVINHHLFFADLAVRESGVAELLPSVQTVIFDEAHQLNETGVQFLGQQLSGAQVLDFVRDLQAVGLQQARGLGPWQELAAAVERAVRELRLCAGRTPAAGGRLAWHGPAPERVDAGAWQAALQALAAACAAAAQALEAVHELGPDLQRLAERARSLQGLAERFGREGADDGVRWVELGATGMQLRLVESPLDIAAAMQARLLPASAQQGGGGARAWIFTSATLGEDERLSWFTEPCGLQQARVLRVDSPFDYARQAALYVPRPFPQPGSAGHTAAVAALVAQLAQGLGGRTLVLTTTLRALRELGERLPALLPAGMELLCQGQGSKAELLQRFRTAGSHAGQGAVLVASASFWEGVDVPGEALQLVVIDKLPFPPPNDPLVQARSQRLTQAGRSAFGDYHLPEAAVALKQGAGRLIRSETDRGLLVICDSRLDTMGYGRRLQAALPPMQRLQTPQQVQAWLAALTTASTTDGC